MKLDSRFLEMTTTPMKTDEHQTTPLHVEEICILKVQAHGGEPNRTSGKRKISPLQPKDQKKRKIKRRMQPNLLEPVVSEMEKVLQEPVQEQKSALVIKLTERKTYADVLSKVKKDTTLQYVGLARRYRAMSFLS